MNKKYEQTLKQISGLVSSDDNKHLLSACELNIKNTARVRDIRA